MNVAICGTARARQGWPPKEYKNIFNECFNSLCWINDKDNFQIQQWVDNNVVTVVTTMHERIPSTTPGAEPPRDVRDSGSASSHSMHLETSSSE